MSDKTNQPQLFSFTNAAALASIMNAAGALSIHEGGGGRIQVWVGCGVSLGSL
uniref:Uncharacterized protein n=1 Tax=Myoviridae sp. ctqfO1 TaxID=2827710 RepID=A0A8S5T386_9CAUD|nr:MAG TPA: hypothetical protein [Myoviridae sp. ctqfO1]